MTLAGDSLETAGMMDLDREVDYLNLIVRFLARRDLDEMSTGALFRRRGVCEADLLILMGGITTADFAETAAHAFGHGFAKRLMIVGGNGHSSQNLRDNIASHPRYGAVATAGRPEADILADILVEFLGVERTRILVENRSTNCGNNATYALEVARRSGPIPECVVIVQDPLMQRRTFESFSHEWRMEWSLFDCFAPAIPLLGVRDGELAFADPAHAGYYKMKSFLDLLMGEIPRLRDDEQGYGPKGHGFIGHVDIPEAVLDAFDRLLPVYAQHVRPKYIDREIG